MHRFQLKFSSSNDYRHALEILRQINCPFSETSAEHNMRSASSRPDSASSWITSSTIPTFTGNADWGQSNRPWNQGLLRSHTTLGASSPNSFLSDFHARNAGTTTSVEEHQKDVPAHGFSQVANHRALTQEMERPITAPNIDSQTLDQVLPPKRDLPFSKPGPRSSHIPNQHLIVGSSRQTPNVEDMHTVAGVVTASSRPQTARSRVTVPANSSPAQRRLELDTRRVCTTQEREQSVRPAVSSPDINIHYTPTAQPNVSPVAHDKLQQQPNPITSPSLNNTSVSAPLHSTINSTLTSTDLSIYLSTPDSERSRLVNNWICQQLEDDGFRTLCQDVERVWQRIAFGRRS